MSFPPLLFTLCNIFEVSLYTLCSSVSKCKLLCSPDSLNYNSSLHYLLLFEKKKKLRTHSCILLQDVHHKDSLSDTTFCGNSPTSWHPKSSLLWHLRNSFSIIFHSISKFHCTEKKYLLEVNHLHRLLDWKLKERKK